MEFGSKLTVFSEPSEEAVALAFKSVGPGYTLHYLPETGLDSESQFAVGEEIARHVLCQGLNPLVSYPNKHILVSQSHNVMRGLQRYAEGHCCAPHESDGVVLVDGDILSYHWWRGVIAGPVCLSPTTGTWEIYGEDA